MKFTIKYPDTKNIIGTDTSGTVYFENEESNETETLINDYANFFAAGVGEINNVPPIRQNDARDLVYRGDEEEQGADQNDQNDDQPEEAPANIFDESQQFFEDLVHDAQIGLNKKIQLLERKRQELNEAPLPEDQDQEEALQQKQDKLTALDNEIAAMETEKQRTRIEASKFDIRRIEELQHLAEAYRSEKDSAKKAFYWNSFSKKLNWFTEINFRLYKGQNKLSAEPYASFKTVLDRVLRGSGKYDVLDDKRAKFLTDLCGFMDKAVAKAESMQQYQNGLDTLSKDEKKLQDLKEIVVTDANNLLESSARLGIDPLHIDDGIKILSESYEQKLAAINEFENKRSSLKALQKKINNLNSQIKVYNDKIDTKQESINLGFEGTKKNPYGANELLEKNSVYFAKYKRAFGESCGS